MGGVLFWYWSAVPLDWLNINNSNYAYLFTGLIWTTSSLIFVPGFIVFAVLFYKLKTNTAFDTIIAPSLWVLCEWSRAFFFSICAAGPSSLIGPHWTFGFLGYFLSESETLLPLASIGGVYLLSFAVVTFNYLIFHLVFSTNSLKHKALSLVIFILVISSLMRISLEGKSTKTANLKVAVVHTHHYSRPSIPAEVARKRFATYVDLLKDVSSQGDVDLLIFPEDARFIFRAKKYQQESILSDTFKNTDILIIDSSYSQKGDHKYTAFTAYDNIKNTAQESKKILLMPQGEYLPWLISYPAKILGFSSWLESVEKTRTYSRGEIPELLEKGDLKIGALFCAEIMTPLLYRSLVNEGAQVLVNASSHGSFHGSKLLYNQVLKMAKVRAVENDRFFIHAGNVAPSFILNNEGMLLQESPWDADAVIYGEVQTRSN